jgi:hypothetical protein
MMAKETAAKAISKPTREEFVVRRVGIARVYGHKRNWFFVPPLGLTIVRYTTLQHSKHLTRPNVSCLSHHVISYRVLQK